MCHWLGCVIAFRQSCSAMIASGVSLKSISDDGLGCAVAVAWSPSHCPVQGSCVTLSTTPCWTSSSTPVLPTARWEHNLFCHLSRSLFGDTHNNSFLSCTQISPTDECSCGTGLQTPEHILQHCPAHSAFRCQRCLPGAERRKLLGYWQDLQKTVDFVQACI